MADQYDCIVSGSCVVDLICRPVSLDRPIGHGVLHGVDPILLTGGGISSNAGITMARLGLSVGVVSYVGDDAWAPVLRDLYRSEGLDVSLMATRPGQATSTTVVAVDDTGERSFFHCVGAPKTLDAKAYLDRLDLFARSKMLLLGYYSLMPQLEPDLPEIFRRVRALGCKTAMDAAGAGGGMQPLDRILPQLDVYVPSFAEARRQTGETDPEKIVKAFRACGAPGLLGVKLGRQGVLLSPEAGQFVRIGVVEPPGPVIDTTGAGDSFYAGLLAGLIRGLPVDEAGRLGAAAGACCVTAVGGCTGGRDWAATARLAGLSL